MPQTTRPPTQQGWLHRPRLHALIEEGLQSHLLVLLAGPGYGKTQAMGDYLSTLKAQTQVLWLRMKSLDNIGGYFWDHLTRALAQDFPGLSGRMQTMDFPVNPVDFYSFLHVLQEHLTPHPQVIWVFDDFGEVIDRSVRHFVRMLVDAELPNLRLVLLSNLSANNESVAFMSNKRFLILAKDLRFTTCEIAQLYAQQGIELAVGEQRDIERYTEGWPLALHLLVLQHGKTPEPPSYQGQLSDFAVTHLFEEYCFSNYSLPLQRLMVGLSFLDTFTKDLVVDLYGGEKTELEPLWNHVFFRIERVTGRFSMHHLYRLFLQDKRVLLPETQERAFWQRAAEYYVSSGESMDAIACYRKSGDHIQMLNVILGYALTQFGLTEETGIFFLEHIDLLTPEEMRQDPRVDAVRALICLNILQLERAEALLADLEQRLLDAPGNESRKLLGNVYAVRGMIHMIRSQEDFGEQFQKAAAYLQGGTQYETRSKLRLHNKFCFTMADNQPGARERMERVVHAAAAPMNRVLNGGLSGLEHLYSAEAAYLSGYLQAVEQHAYRAIYRAQAYAQHDIVCNAHLLMARVGLMRGDLAEMTGQIQRVVEYAANYESNTLNEIRDTALTWYYVKLRDIQHVPIGIVAMVSAGRPAPAYGRAQILYANYLIHTGEFAKVIGLLDHLQGPYQGSSVSHDGITQYILLAIAHLNLGDREAAVRALWAAYDMSYHNGLTTMFVEAETQMAPLLSAAQQQRQYAFDPDWVAFVRKEAAAYAKRTAAVRAEYKKQNPQREAADNPLTKREMEVLRALAQGLTREEIAAKQYISINTVKTFIRNIYHKLDAANRVDAIAIATARGYMDPFPGR